MNVLGKWRSYRLAKDRLYLFLGVGGVTLLALGICLYIVISLVPAIGVRGDLISTVTVGEQMLAAAQATSAAEPARVQAQVASAQARVQEAANAFLSETQATVALNQLYQYARDSGVTITELKTQPAPQTDAQSVARINTFALRATGALPRLLNFLARIRETTNSGFVIDNVTITPEEAPNNTNAAPQHVASMNVLLYTSPYAETAATQPISGVVTTLPPLTPGAVQTTPVLTIPVLSTAQPSPIAAACANGLSNGDFEQDGGWIVGNALTPPQIVNNQPHGGARAMGLGNAPELGANDRSGDSAIRQLVTIPMNAPGVTLRWWHRYGTSEAIVPDQATTGDRQEILLLNAEGQPLATLQQVRRNDAGWQAETLDLTAYRGQTLYLVFNVFNDGNGLPTWLYVDDVQLDTCTAVTPLPTSLTALPPGLTATPIVAPAPTNTPLVVPAPTNTPIVVPAPTNTPLVVPVPTNTGLPPTTAPATATPPAITVTPTTASCANLLINGDFEGDSGWLLGQTALQPQYTTAQRHGGARAIGLGSTPERGVFTHNSYSSIRQLITLPATASVVTLRWWHLYGSAEAITTDPGTAGDRQEVLLLTADGRVLTMLQRVRRNDGVWQQEIVDLTAYRGQTVYLYFNVFINNNGVATWAYLDDVQLDTCAGAGPQPTATNTPIAMATATNTPILAPTATNTPLGIPTATNTPILAPTATNTPLGIPTATNTPIVAPTATNTPIVLATNTSTPTVTPSPLGSPTATATTTASCTDLVVNGNFEADGNWESELVNLPPQIINSQYHGAARSMQLGNPPGFSTEKQSYSSIRQRITIPLNATSVTLRWWHFAGTQEAVVGDPGNSGDRQEVLLLTQSGQPLAVIQRTRRNDSGWQEEAVDLTAYRGQTIYVYINVFNDGNNGSTWMYVDDLQMNACS